jgi:putative sigma-54 modulation protein
MNIIINSVHFRADKKLETLITEKLKKLPAVFDAVIGAEVKLKLDNNDSHENKIVEIRVLVPGNDLYSVKQAKTFEEASTKAIDVSRRQLRKHKERLRGI